MENLGNSSADGYFDERYWADIEASQAQQRQLGHDIGAAEAAAHAEAASRTDQGDGIVARHDPLN